MEGDQKVGRRAARTWGSNKMTSFVAEASRALRRIISSPISVMEVCGTHTVSIFRSGIRSLLPPELRLVSGPGCPVCVTDQGEIDCALSLLDSGVTLAAYGDMFRVPGKSGSLASRREMGFDARVVTSALDLIEIALGSPSREVVFLAVGFETTAPATAALLLEASQRRIHNLSVLSFHKRTPPALAALSSDPELNLSGFLLPGHVSVILGHEPFRFLAENRGLPAVIAGFDPGQIMAGLVEIALQHQRGEARLGSVYGRAVRPEGNEKARSLMDRVFASRDSCWRGLGPLADSGMALREEYSEFDAERRFSLSPVRGTPPPDCKCGEVLTGRISPPDCALFGTGCTPASPAGPCMVSAEGACGAFFRFCRRNGGSRCG